MHRPNLAQTLTDQLRQRIVAGRLAAASRINEVHLAEELDVSRTPLREALVALAAEDLVQIRPRRGFFVAELDADHMRDLYGIRALLDPQALRLAGPPPAARLAQLRTLNARLAAEERAEQRVTLDNRWHRDLVGHCPNRVLLDLIDRFMVLTRRYELAYFGETDGALPVALAEHESILQALERGNLDAACDALHRNMVTAIEPLQLWLARRAAGP